MASTVLFVALVVAGPVLLAFTFLAIRSLVRSSGHRAPAGAGVAAALVALCAYAALGFGGLEAYPDSACSSHAPKGSAGGSYTQAAGLWPPGLECRFDGPAGQRTVHRSGYGAVWKGIAATAALATTMALGVVALDQAKRRLGMAPISSDVAPSAL